MNHRIEFSWKSLAEASEEATRKFTWAAIGLFMACSVLAYYSISTYLHYSKTCQYIGAYAPPPSGQQVDESDLARALLHKYCG